jgi:hypothetical protein
VRREERDRHMKNAFCEAAEGVRTLRRYAPATFAILVDGSVAFLCRALAGLTGPD